MRSLLFFIWASSVLASENCNDHFTIGRKVPEVTAETAEVRANNQLIPTCPNVSQKKLLIQEIGHNLLESPGYLFKCGLHKLRMDDFNVLLKENPGAFSLYFAPNAHRQVPNSRHFFAFNYEEVAQVCDNNFGFCRGFSVSLVRWNRHAHFIDDPKAIGHNVELPIFKPRSEGQSYTDFFEQNKPFLEFYKPAIKSIQEGSPAIIYGFQDLKEFSSNPIIQHFLKENVALTWARENASISSLTRVLPRVNKKMTKDEWVSLRDGIDLRINKLSYNPVMLVTRPQKESWLNGKGYYHVMQAFHVTPIENNRFSIYLLDLDYTEVSKNVRRVEIDLSGEHPIVFGDVKVQKKRQDQINTANVLYEFGPVSSIGQVPFDDMDVGDDLMKLSEFYGKYPELFYQKRRYDPVTKRKEIEELIQRSEKMGYVRAQDKSMFDEYLSQIEVVQIYDHGEKVEVVYHFSGKKKKANLVKKKIEEAGLNLKDTEELKKYLITQGFVDHLLQYF